MLRRMVLATALVLSTWAVAHPTVAAAADRKDVHNSYTTNYRDTRNVREVRVHDSHDKQEVLRQERVDRARREREARERLRHDDHRGYDAWYR